MSLHTPRAGLPPPPYSTSTPIPQSQGSPFGMVRINTSPSADQFLMHQARLSASMHAATAAAAAASYNVNNSPANSSNSSCSSEDKSSGGETPMSRTNQYKKVRTWAK